jgi:hypothetical protein
MNTTKVNIHEYPKDESLLPQYRVAVMQAALEGKPVEYDAPHRGEDWSSVEEPVWNWAKYRYRIASPKIAQGHNPEKLTEDQIGVKDGYRTLSVEENEALGPNLSSIKGLEFRDNKAWKDGNMGGVSDLTYRTKHPIGHFLPKTPPKVTRYFRPKDGLFKPGVREFSYWMEVLPDGSSRFAYIDGEYRGTNESWTLAQCEAYVASGDWVEFDGNVEPFRPKPAPATHWTDTLPQKYADLAKKRRAEFVAVTRRGYDLKVWDDSTPALSFPWMYTPEEGQFWTDVHNFLNGLTTVLPCFPCTLKPKVKKFIPWTLETVPFPVLLREKGLSNRAFFLPDRAVYGGLEIQHVLYTWDELLESFEYSLEHDNRTWLPCGKEVDSE